MTDDLVKRLRDIGGTTVMEAADEIERLGSDKPSSKVDLEHTEEVLGALAKRIEDEPNSIGPTWIWVKSDRSEAMLLRGLISNWRSSYDAFHSCLPAMEKERKRAEAAEAKLAEVKDDYLRVQNEKMDRFERAIAAEAEVARLREALKEANLEPCDVCGALVDKDADACMHCG